MYWRILKTLIWMIIAENSYSATQNALLPVDQVTIKLKEEATLDNNRIYLSDIASCFGSEQICQEGYGIEISIFPDNISSFQLNSAKILQTLESEWPLVSVSMSGASSVKLHKKKSLSNDNDLIAKLELRLKTIKNLGYELEISKIKMDQVDQYSRLEPIGFNEQDLTDPQWIQSNLNGKKTVSWAGFDESSEEPQNTYQSEVWFSLRKYIPAANRDLPKGTTITESDLSRNLAPIHSPSYNNDFKDPDTAAKVLIGRKTKTDLKKDQPILLNNTELPVAIRKNQTVNIVVNGNGLMVGFIGKSLQDGSIGELIDISYPNSKKVFKARIIDEQHAEMTKSGSLVTNP